MSYIREDQRQAFETHNLNEVVNIEAVRVFEMRRPSTSFYSAVLSFYRTGHVVIFGDLRIGDGPGIVGLCDFTFFASPLNGEDEYLASKFLRPARRPNSGEARRRWDNDAGWLAACQEKFAELYAKRLVTA